MGCPQISQPARGEGWNLTSGLMTPTLLREMTCGLDSPAQGVSNLLQHEDSFFPSEIIVISCT